MRNHRLRFNLDQPLRQRQPADDDPYALDYLAGYTVCNDYAIRDYLENYYRPNLRVKNRDATTPVGPWIVDVADVPSFMTLQPGDMIATGTPEGLADVVPGDEVVVEVEGVGRLVNRIVSEAEFF